MKLRFTFALFFLVLAFVFAILYFATVTVSLGIIMGTLGLVNPDYTLFEQIFSYGAVIYFILFGICFAIKR